MDPPVNIWCKEFLLRDNADVGHVGGLCILAQVNICQGSTCVPLGIVNRQVETCSKIERCLVKNRISNPGGMATTLLKMHQILNRNIQLYIVTYTPFQIYAALITDAPI